MKSKTMPNEMPKTEAEYQQEADRLIGEIRVMLDNARRTSEESRRIGAENQRLLEDLERRVLCGNK